MVFWQPTVACSVLAPSNLHCWVIATEVWTWRLEGDSLAPAAKGFAGTPRLCLLCPCSSSRPAGCIWFFCHYASTRRLHVKLDKNTLLRQKLWITHGTGKSRCSCCIFHMMHLIREDACAQRGLTAVRSLTPFASLFVLEFTLKFVTKRPNFMGLFLKLN